MVNNTMSEDDTTTHVRIRKTTLSTIEKLLTKNPAFGTVADVIDHAIRMLERMQSKK
jgi:hypothetical protein